MDYYEISNIGDREINEDSIVSAQKEGKAIFVLADGLGGHGRGEVASKILTDTARELFVNKYDNNTILEDIFDEAQRRMLEKQRKEGACNEMKTTAVILLVSEADFRWGYIGDSRLYYFRKNRLISRTLDHSVPQILVCAGEIKESKIRNHPDRNRLLRVMGVEWDKPEYVISDPIKREGKEAFLLCSDGFWENILEKDMLKLLKKSKSSDVWLKNMNDIVQSVSKEEMDNNSAIAVML